jgi:hypothetical protein
VKEIPDRGGRLPYRLWYEETEIEEIIHEELHAAGPPWMNTGTAVDIELFMERHLGLVPDYVWLPRGVMGATEFTPDGKARVQISAELSLRAEKERAAARLLRSTVAHEVAHLLLHRHLFLKETAAMFGGLDRRTELCRSIDFPRSGYQGEWWEWQANRGMSCLLLPADELAAWVTAWQTQHPRSRVVEMRDEAAAAFQVSAESVRRRLSQLSALAATR